MYTRDMMLEVCHNDYRNWDAVYEAYFGKNNLLKEAENIIKEIYDMVNYGLDNGNVPKINNTPQAKKLEEIIKKQFGFKEVTIDWGIKYEPIVSPLTLVFTNAIPEINNVKSRLEFNKTGEVKAQNNQSLYVKMNMYLLNRADLSPSESMAILLHEIGHNIEISMVTQTLTLMSILSSPTSIVKRLGEETGTRVGAYLLTNVAKYFAKEKEGAASYNIFEKAYIDLVYKVLDMAQFNGNSKIADMIVSIYNKLGQRDIKQLIPKLITDIKSFMTKPGIAGIALKNLSAYSTEKYADSFATAFGYGPELMRGLEKINIFTQAHPDESELVAAAYPIYEVFLLATSFTTNMLSSHPDTQTRLRSQIDKLKRELNNPDLSPKLRKMIEEDIKNAEAIYEQYLNVHDDNRLFISKFSRQIAEKFFGGKMNVKELLNALWSKGEL